MVQGKYIKIIWAILLSMSLSGCYFLPKEEEEVIAPELIESDKELYKTQPVEVGDIDERIVCSGIVIPSEMIPQYFVEGGKIKKYYVMQGDTVEKGQLLAEIESSDFEIEIEKQNFVIKRAQLELTASQEERHKELEENIQEANEMIQTLENELESLKEKLLLNKELLEAGLIAKAEVTTLENQMSEQEANKKVYEIKCMKWQEELDSGDSMDTAREQLVYEEAIFNRQLLEEKREKAKLYASSTGVISYKTNKLAGEIVSGEEKIFQIANLDNFLIKYEGDSATSFEIGETVILNYKDIDYEVEVVMTPKTVPTEKKNELINMVYFKIKDASLASILESGIMVKITKIKKASKSVLLVPTKSIITIAGKNYIYVLENGIRMQKGIEIGISNNAYTEVRDGIKEGELIIMQ